MKLFVLLFFVLLIAFNFTYFANSGLLIFNLKNVKSLHKHTKRAIQDPLSLSQYSMEQMLTLEESRAIADMVKGQSSLWKKRNAAMSTLGTASYLDGSNATKYKRLSKESNPLISDTYGELLQTVLAYFQVRCPSASVKYRKNAALPGFHIFHCNKLFAMPVASVHKDMQYKRLSYSNDEDIDTENTLSFTLALELPEGGGGLYTFNPISLPFPANIIVPKPLLYNLGDKERINYIVGYMVTHNGQTSHMISPSPASDKYRITLQGHGVYDKSANTWWLYW